MSFKCLLLVCLVLTCLSVPRSASAQRDRGSWKKTLHDKAMLFEKTTAERHNILGTYPSSVRLVPPAYFTKPEPDDWQVLTETGTLPEGWTVDQGTTGPSNVAHTSSWTGCLLTAEAFHVAFLRRERGEDSPEYKAAYERANEIIGGLRILTLVSGQPGYLARGIALGHGISYEERAGAGTSDLWKQGAGEFKHLRYRGGPSHHNYDQVFRGLGMYYFLAADEAQKEAIRAIVADMSNWAHLEHGMRVMHVDGKRESTVLIGGWRALEGVDQPSGGSLMATTGLKIAGLITGNPKVKALYEEWVDRLGYRDPERTRKNIMGEPRENYDDTDHLLGDLYLLNLIEDDPDLLRFYRKCVKDSWQAHKTEKMSWYNYIYGAVLGEEFADKEGSLWNLQTFPTCRIFQPQRNSIRTDIEFTTESGRLEAKRPLPVYERRSDNEYEWKNSPFALDGWLARIVSVVEVSPHDPYVIFAADTAGVSYYSLTKGKLWYAMPGLPRVNDFLFSSLSPRFAFAATDGGIYRTTDGGRSWAQVLPAKALRLKAHPADPYVLYAVTPGGVWKSRDLGEADLGLRWRALGRDEGPPGAVYAVAPGADGATLYMQTREGLSRRNESEDDWTMARRPRRMRGFGEYELVEGPPRWLRADATTPGRLFRGVEMTVRHEKRLLLSVSDDNGDTWQPVVRGLDRLIKWDSDAFDSADMPREEVVKLFGLAEKFPITDIRVDSRDPNRWYGLMPAALAITEDAGATWRISTTGLDILQTEALAAPRASTDLYLGTPAGLYVSHDGGETFRDTTLIPQFEGAQREEIGGIGYLEAYWIGRYHGFITEDTAHETWW